MFELFFSFKLSVSLKAKKPFCFTSLQATFVDAQVRPTFHNCVTCGQQLLNSKIFLSPSSVWFYFVCLDLFQTENLMKSHSSKSRNQCTDCPSKMQYSRGSLLAWTLCRCDIGHLVAEEGVETIYSRSKFPIGLDPLCIIQLFFLDHIPSCVFSSMVVKHGNFRINNF